MSGTSLDGVDIACCLFQLKNQKWEFRIEKAKAVPYTDSWSQKLSTAHTLSSDELIKLHVEYGVYLGNLCKKFIRLYGIKQVDFIASHGHTVFHRPDKKFTFQISLCRLHGCDVPPLNKDGRGSIHPFPEWHLFYAEFWSVPH